MIYICIMLDISFIFFFVVVSSFSSPTIYILSFTSYTLFYFTVSVVFSVLLLLLFCFLFYFVVCYCYCYCYCSVRAHVLLSAISIAFICYASLLAIRITWNDDTIYTNLLLWYHLIYASKSNFLFESDIIEVLESTWIQFPSLSPDFVFQFQIKTTNSL